MATTTGKKAAAKKAAASIPDDTPAGVDVDQLREQVAALTSLVQQAMGLSSTSVVDPVAAADDDQAADDQAEDPEMTALRAQLAELQTPEDPREAEIRQLKEQIAGLLSERQARADGTGPARPVRYNLMLATGEVVQHDNAGSSTHHYSEKLGQTVPVSGVWLVPADE